MKAQLIASLAGLGLALAGCGNSQAPAPPYDGGGGDGGACHTSLTFEVKFRPSGAATALECDAARVGNVRFRFYRDDPDGGSPLRFEVVRPCVPGARYPMEPNPGPYTLVIHGLDSRLVACYQTSRFHTVESCSNATLTVEVPQVPTGAEAGCVYP